MDAKNYCCKSSIHGLKYLTERDLTKTERLWWLLILILSIIGSGFLLYRTAVKFTRKGIVLTEVNKPESVANIPFPSITICSPVFIDHEKVNITKYQEDWDYADALEDKAKGQELKNRLIDDVMAMYMFCRAEDAKALDDAIAYNVTTPLPHTYTPKYKGDGYEFPGSFLFEMKPDLLKNNVIGGFPVHGIRYFTTPIGLCVSFNSLTKVKKTDWNPDTGFINDTVGLKGNPSVPNRAKGGGGKGRVIFPLNTMTESWRRSCRAESFYINIFLHSPEELAFGNEKRVFIPHNTSVNIEVVPKIITTDPSLRSYSPKERGCLYQDESELVYFNYYTINNCRKECLTNYSMQHSNCTFFFLPRPSPSVPICIKNGFSWEFYDDHSSMENLIENGIISEFCRCLPSCSSFEYEEFNSIKFPYDNYHPMIAVNFYSSLYYYRKREPPYDYVDFVADCGGQLALVSGISLLSLWELFYYFTLRAMYRRSQGTAKNRETGTQTEKEKEQKEKLIDAKQTDQTPADSKPTESNPVDTKSSDVKLADIPNSSSEVVMVEIIPS